MSSLMFQFEKDEWAENHGIQVGSCNIHNVRVWDGDCEECAKSRCIECDEYKPNDGRVEAGMKCGECAYG